MRKPFRAIRRPLSGLALLLKLELRSTIETSLPGEDHRIGTQNIVATQRIRAARCKTRPRLLG
jgi:hypothetical protein